MLANRREGGRVLARKLQIYGSRPDVLVLGLPRGGVPVAYEVAETLGAPLDVFVVRKLGLPGHEEFAIGAIASGALRFRNRLLIEAYAVPERSISQIEAREEQELARRERAYRGGEPPLDVIGKTIILVDDGLASGASMNAAVVALRQARPARIVVAVPVAPPDTCEGLRSVADSVVCAMTPEPFVAVGRWYEDFEPTTDAEVKHLLAKARARRSVSRDRAPTRRRGGDEAGPRDSGHRSDALGGTMATREIPRESWTEFFDGFSRRHEGWLVNVEVLGPAGAQKEANELPLEGITADRRGHNIEISVGRSNQATHVIAEPSHVRIEEEEGADRALQIESASGVTTLVSFRSPMPPEMVDGILPGEAS